LGAFKNQGTGGPMQMSTLPMGKYRFAHFICMAFTAAFVQQRACLRWLCKKVLFMTK